MSKCVNQNMLVTLHLEHANCLVLLTTQCKESLKFQKSVQMLIKHSMGAQEPFLHEHYFHHTKHHWCSCKVYNGVATTNWSQCPHINSQHNENMTTSHDECVFSPHTNHLQIVLLFMCLWAARVSMGRCPRWLDVYSCCDCGWKSWNHP